MKINAGTLRMTDPLSSTPPTGQEKNEDDANPAKIGDRLDISADGREAASGLPKVALDPDAKEYAAIAKSEEREKTASADVRLDGNTLKKGGGGGFAGAGAADEAEDSGDESQKLIKELQKQIAKLQEKRREIANMPQGKERDSQLSSIDAQISVLQAQVLEASKKSGGSSGGTPGLEATGGSGLNVKAHFA